MKKITLLLLFLTGFTFCNLPVGSKAPEICLSGKDGGRTDKKPWCSKMIKDKVYTLFYVDPDEKDLNKELEDALEKANFPRAKYNSIGIINMKDTWLPNALISTMLKQKQEKFPDVVYVEDRSNIFASKWGLARNSYHVVLFDKEGVVQYSKYGTLNTGEIQTLLELIRKFIK